VHAAGVAAEQRRRDADAAFQAERESLGAEVRTPPKTGVSRLRRATRIDSRGAPQARDARDAAAEAWQRSADRAEEVEALTSRLAAARDKLEASRARAEAEAERADAAEERARGMVVRSALQVPSLSESRHQGPSARAAPARC